MTVAATPETLTDAALVHALARFYAAEHFRAGSPRISDELAKFIGYNTVAVGPAVVKALAVRGWLSFPDGGQRTVTEAGRKAVCDAITARGAKP